MADDPAPGDAARWSEVMGESPDRKDGVFAVADGLLFAVIDDMAESHPGCRLLDENPRAGASYDTLLDRIDAEIDAGRFRETDRSLIGRTFRPAGQSDPSLHVGVMAGDGTVALFANPTRQNR